MISILRFFAAPLLCALFLGGLIVFNPASILAQPVLFTYTTPPQPLHIQVRGAEIHVLCGQVDNNFNGTQDMGDVPASWVVLSANAATTLRSRQFLWNEGVGFPCRPAYDFSSNTLYLAQSGRIRAFDTQTQATKRDTVLLLDTLARSAMGTSGTVAGLSFARVGIMGQDLLSLTLRGRSTSAVVQVLPATGRVSRRLGAGIFAQQAIAYTTPVDGVETVILNEGGFGTSTATLMIADGGNDVTTLNLGDTGNHLLVSGGQAIVTMNGSHTIQVIDLATRRIIRTIPTGTTGFNGPREAVLIGTTLYVTTYASDVRAFDILTGREVTRFNPRGKPEGIAALGNNIIVANAFEAGGFASANTVVVLNTTTSVQENRAGADVISLAPNPTQDRTTLRFQGKNGLGENVRISLVSTLGNEIAELFPVRRTTTGFEAEFSANDLGLAQGMYFVHIRSAQGMTALPVQIVR
ncbi:MAG: T9SS C-terminal target domain-containing protein [Candidatus Kapaibacterium sp.]|nr:MAG: T9SS C-terminal target domain-containing protein [Candidatus Kapabacteria bacterium]